LNLLFKLAPRLVLAPLLALAGCGGAPFASEWERQHGEQLAKQEEAPALPPYPERRNLIAFDLLAPTDMQYFIDAASLSVGPDSIVRYVMLARSPQGAENVSFEALRCPREYRVYAIGQPGGGWLAQPGAWRDIPRGVDSNAQYSLARNYFCPYRVPLGSAAEGLRALRAGSHPHLR
jgi:hypothetical protein